MLMVATDTGSNIGGMDTRCRDSTESSGRLQRREDGRLVRRKIMRGRLLRRCFGGRVIRCSMPRDIIIKGMGSGDTRGREDGGRCRLGDWQAGKLVGRITGRNSN